MRTRAIDSTTYTPSLSFVCSITRSTGGFKRAFCSVRLIDGSVEHFAILPANRGCWRWYRLGFGFFSVPTPSKQHSNTEYHYKSYSNRVFVHTSLVQSQSILSLTVTIGTFLFLLQPPALSFAAGAASSHSVGFCQLVRQLAIFRAGDRI